MNDYVELLLQELANDAGIYLESKRAKYIRSKHPYKKWNPTVSHFTELEKKDWIKKFHYKCLKKLPNGDEIGTIQASPSEPIIEIKISRKYNNNEEYDYIYNVIKLGRKSASGLVTSFDIGHEYTHAIENPNSTNDLQKYKQLENKYQTGKITSEEDEERKHLQYKINKNLDNMDTIQYNKKMEPTLKSILPETRDLTINGKLNYHDSQPMEQRADIGGLKYFHGNKNLKKIENDLNKNSKRVLQKKYINNNESITNNIYKIKLLKKELISMQNDIDKGSRIIQDYKNQLKVLYKRMSKCTNSLSKITIKKEIDKIIHNLKLYESSHRELAHAINIKKNQIIDIKGKNNNIKNTIQNDKNSDYNKRLEKSTLSNKNRIILAKKGYDMENK